MHNVYSIIYIILNSSAIFQEISSAYNTAVISLDKLIHEAVLNGTGEAGLKAREACERARYVAVEEDALAQLAPENKGGKGAKGGRRMCKCFHVVDLKSFFLFWQQECY